MNKRRGKCCSTWNRRLYGHRAMRLAAVTVVAGLLAVSCSKEDRDKAKEKADAAAEKTSDALKSASDKVSDTAKNAGEKIKDGAQRAGQSITNGATKAWDATKTEAQKASDAVKAKLDRNTAPSQQAPTATNDTSKVP